jgi:hypothetical protein
MHRCPVHDSDFSRSLECCHLGSSHQPSFFHSMGLFATSHTSLLFFQGVIATVTSTRVPQQNSQLLPLNATIRCYIPSYSSPICYHSSLQLPPATSGCKDSLRRSHSSAPVSPGCTGHYYDIASTIYLRTMFTFRYSARSPPPSHHCIMRPSTSLSLPPSSLLGPLFLTSSSIANGAIHIEVASTYAFKPSFGITPPTIHSGYHLVLLYLG